MQSISTSAVTQALVAAGLTPGPTVPGATPGTVDPGASVPRPDTVSPGFGGFLTVFLLACATVLLMRSMTKHLRKVRYAPGGPDPAGTSAPVPGGPGGPGGPGPSKMSGETPPGTSDGRPRPT
jgi:hypothetical protein